MLSITHKQGDTFIARGTYCDDVGNPIDLVAAGITVKSALRIPDTKYVYPLTVTPNPAETGQFDMRADTSKWKFAISMDWDIQYFDAWDNLIKSTETVTVYLDRDVTP